MLRLLDRYLLNDLLRLTLVTTAVLVTLTAFGAAIKPLANESLLSVSQTLKYIVLVIVPMLQYALPFAAGFAGTLSLHRMSADNELVAAAVSGVSYRRMLAPVAGLGLALTVVMLALTQWVVPRFWGFIDKAVAEDVTRIFQAQIERGEPFQFGGRQIYADEIVVQPGPEGSTADTRLILLRVAAAEIDDSGRIDKDVTANRAIVDVYREPGFTFVRLSMLDAVAYDPEAGVLAQAERLDSRTIVIPSGRRDHPMHKTRSELHEMRRNPDLNGSVSYRKRELAEALRDDVIWAQLDQQLAARGAVDLAAAREDGPRYTVRAERLAGGRFRVGEGQVEIVRIDADRPVRRFDADHVQLVRRVSGPGEPIRFDLVLTDCTVTSLEVPGVSNRRERIALENLALSGITAADLVDLPSAALLERVDAAGDAATPLLRALAADLRDEIEELRVGISGRLQSRYALTLTAPLLVLLGATLAMCFRGAMPLTIYLLAFLPSIADLILISGGEQMVRDGVVRAGSVVLWSGNAVLAALLIGVYARLRRH